MPKSKKEARVTGNLLLRSRGRSVLKGMARLGDLSRMISSDDAAQIISQTDADGLRDDWRAVGSELERAIETFGRRKAS